MVAMGILQPFVNRKTSLSLRRWPVSDTMGNDTTCPTAPTEVAAATIERAIDGVSDEEREIDMVGVSNVLGKVLSSLALA
jgi:hypothetical protein